MAEHAVAAGWSDVSPQQIQQEAVALQFVPVRTLVQYQHDVHTGTSGRGRALTGMVGLHHPAAPQQHVAPLLEGRADFKLELAVLVAAQPALGQVVALHQQPGPAQSPRQIG